MLSVQVLESRFGYFGILDYKTIDCYWINDIVICHKNLTLCGTGLSTVFMGTAGMDRITAG